MSDEEDDNQISDRAAPTRKRFHRTSNSDKGDSSASTPQVDDEKAEDFIKGVTGKRFSITKLFQRESKKETQIKAEDAKNSTDQDSKEQTSSKS